MLAKRCRSGSTQGGYDLTAILINDLFPAALFLAFILRLALRPRPRKISSLETEPLGNALQFLPTRISWNKVPLHVVEHAGHLTEDIAGRREVKQLRLRSIKIAHRAFES